METGLQCAEFAGHVGGLELARLDIKEGLYGSARDQLDRLLGTEHPYFESAFVLNDRPAAESLLTQIRGK